MHPNRARRRRALAVLLAAALAAVLTPVLGVAGALPAAAHDRLVSSDPADDATVDEAPTRITLVFSADVLAAGAQVAVTTADGTVAAQVSVDGDEATAALPEGLPAGDWDVSWRVVSSDGHPIEGNLAFTVEGAASPSPSPSASPEPSASPTPETATSSPTATPSGHVHRPGGTPGADLDADGEAGWATAWLFPVAVLAAVAVAAGLLLQRRRQAEADAGDGATPATDDPGDQDKPDDPVERR